MNATREFQEDTIIQMIAGSKRQAFTFSLRTRFGILIWLPAIVGTREKSCVHVRKNEKGEWKNE